MIDANESALSKYMDKVENDEKDYELLLEALGEELDDSLLKCYEMFVKMNAIHGFISDKRMFMDYLEEIL